MNKDEALKLALEALEEAWYHVGTFQPTEKAIDLYDEARTAIKEALAQPEQEPVAYIQVSKTGNVMACAKTGDFYKLPDKTLLYTSPQPAPVQEPVAWWNDTGTHIDLNVSGRGTPLYTHSPQRQPLTDEEMKKIWYAMQNIMGWYSFQEIARAIEAKLKDKNTRGKE